MKPKRFDFKTPLEQMKIKQHNDDTIRDLNGSLLNWDKARLAVRWMIRDYQLLVGSYLTQQSLLEFTVLREPPQEHLSAQSTPQSQRNQQHLDEVVSQLNLASLELYLQRFENEHDHLNIALNYHDSALKGTLSSQECGDLSASNFAQLDFNHDNLISYGDIRSSVSESASDIRLKEVRMEKLRSECDELHVRRDQSNVQEQTALMDAQRESLLAEINRLQAEIDAGQNFIRSVWLFLHSAFAANIFGSEITPTKPAQVSFSTLSNEIDRICETGCRNTLLDSSKKPVMPARPQLAQPTASSQFAIPEVERLHSSSTSTQTTGFVEDLGKATTVSVDSSKIDSSLLTKQEASFV